MSAPDVDPATDAATPSMPSGNDGRPLCVTEVTSDYWRVTFDNPPINLSTPTSSRPSDYCSIGSKWTRKFGCSCSTQRILTTTSRIWACEAHLRSAQRTRRGEPRRRMASLRDPPGTLAGAKHRLDSRTRTGHRERARAGPRHALRRQGEGDHRATGSGLRID
jgi:hypothetical protein